MKSIFGVNDILSPSGIRIGSVVSFMPLIPNVIEPLFFRLAGLISVIKMTPEQVAATVNSGVEQVFSLFSSINYFAGYCKGVGSWY